MPRKAKNSKSRREDPSEFDERLERMQVEAPSDEEGRVAELPDPDSENEIAEERSQYEEYYALDRYATDRWKDEFYARNSKTGEIYRRNKNTGKPIFAKRKNDEHVLEEFPASDHLGRLKAAADDEGKHHYPKRANTDDGHVIPKISNVDGYLIDEDGNEIYPRDENNREYYVKDFDGSPIFARRVTGEQFYATCDENGDVVEYLPEGPNGNPVYIRLSDDDEYSYRYPINRTKQKPLYHQDGSSGDPIYNGLSDMTQYYGTNEDGDEIYGVNINTGNEMYARDRDGNQILAKLRDGIPYYAKWSNGEEIYPRKSSTGQYYKTVDDVEICALDAQGFPVYAKNNRQDEIYPKKWLTEV